MKDETLVKTLWRLKLPGSPLPLSLPQMMPWQGETSIKKIISLPKTPQCNTIIGVCLPLDLTAPPH